MFLKSLHSNNNKVGKIIDNGERVKVSVSNKVLNKRKLLYADDEEDLEILVDVVLRFFAAREIDYKYYPSTYLPWGKDTFYRFDVLGTKYRGFNAQSQAEDLDSGDIVLLIREGDNPQDEDAIRVTTMDGTTIGYVPARRCDDVSCMIDNIGIAIVESNNLYDDKPITVLFPFEYCELKDFDWNKIAKPKPRLKTEGANPVRGKYFDVVGRFKTLGSQSRAIDFLEDLGGVAYWCSFKYRYYKEPVEPQIIVIGDGSQEKTYNEVMDREKANPHLKVMLESELTALIDKLQPGFLDEIIKQKKKTEVPKEIKNARSYISTYLRKLESGEGNVNLYKNNIQQRVNILLNAKVEMSDDLLLRLMYAGIEVE